MNLFILSRDPAKAAEQMMDKHVNKILLEAQRGGDYDHAEECS
jgi:hypothetical protein